MEVEPTPQMLGKKLWNIVRIVLYMLKKGFTKNKLMLDLHMIFKRGKIAGKAMSQIMHHLHQDYSFACNSTDVRMSIIPLREYEFSCSNTPAPYLSYFSKLKNNHHRRRSCYYGAAEDMNLARKVFDVLYKYEGVTVDASPLVSLPGFGHSPMVRQLRVTDSPFSVKDSEENPQVDTDCEEFINTIRDGWKRQEMVAAAIESPSPYHLMARSRF